MVVPLLHLKSCNENTCLIELEILNSQPQYIEIAYHKKALTLDDIKEQHAEARAFQTMRFLVFDHAQCIGLVEYGMYSPRQQLPWINLLCIDAQFNRQGYAKKVLQLVEQNMYNDGAEHILLAVHETNEMAQSFWERAGFIAFEKRIVEGDRLISYKKTLTSNNAK